MLRLLHLAVIGMLVSAAAYVYKIKFDSAVQAERAAKVRDQVRREREAIAYLKAQWSRLDNPSRIQGLADRHLELRPIEPAQFSDFSNLPKRPPPIVPPDAEDAIAALIDLVNGAEVTTGSTTPPPIIPTPPTTPHALED